MKNFNRIPLELRRVTALTGLGLILFLVFGVVPLLGQTDLIKQKADLTEQIRRLRNQMAEEKKLFESFRLQKEKIISFKTKENESLNQDIRTKTAEIRNLRRQLTQVEAEIMNLDKQGGRVNQQIRRFALDLQAEIDQGIPFEREKRKSLLSALIFDIDNSGVSANESFSRLVSFLNLEQNLSYDSEVIRTALEVGGTKKDVNVIRIGRVFFAVNDGQAVYLWRIKNGKYELDENEMDPFSARPIKDAEEIIQGKRVPDLVVLPFPGSQIGIRQAPQAPQAPQAQE